MGVLWNPKYLLEYTADDLIELLYDSCLSFYMTASREADNI
jgi:hypothetical protein